MAPLQRLMAELVAFFPRKHHVGLMANEHPPNGAAYRVLPQNDMTYGVEVVVPGAYPAVVTSFATVQNAETWITDHKRRVAENTFYKFAGRRTRPSK